MNIDYIASENCTKCDLHKTRKNIVWGDGDQFSPIIFVGEGPGKEEDEKGKAFIGRSGIYLNDIFKMLHVNRKDVLILNIVCCRPPGNRNPSIDEIYACHPRLKRQIHLAENMKIMVALGKISWYGLTGLNTPVIANHGKVIKHGKHNILYTYHPSFLLRNRSIDRKKEFIGDINKAFKIAGMR